MVAWAFLEERRNHPNAELVQRFQTQTISDIYRTIQARLDGYRQSASAVFLGIVAAAFSLDTVLVRCVIDPSPLTQSTSPDRGVDILVLCLVSVMPALLAICGLMVNGRLGANFAEMSSIVYKIDVQNEVFAPGVWLPDVSLYPKSFSQMDRRPVGKHKEDKALMGWRDPSIRVFRFLTWMLAVTHSIVAAVLIVRLNNGFGVDASAIVRQVCQWI